MIAKLFYKLDDDGVKLFKRFAVLENEFGMPLRDQDNNFIPSGFKIQKVGTDEIYDDAVDVEDAPYRYIETNIPVDTHTQESEETTEEPSEEQ